MHLFCVWISGIALRLPGLVVSTFTHRVTELPQYNILN